MRSCVRGARGPLSTDQPVAHGTLKADGIERLRPYLDNPEYTINGARYGFPTGFVRGATSSFVDNYESAYEHAADVDVMIPEEEALGRIQRVTPLYKLFPTMSLIRNPMSIVVDPRKGKKRLVIDGSRNERVSANGGVDPSLHPKTSLATVTSLCKRTPAAASSSRRSTSRTPTRAVPSTPRTGGSWASSGAARCTGARSPSTATARRATRCAASPPPSRAP